ncbi:unnamed protein product [Adineta ricciae]|nr:unnamed protein product [Adineta ricciae]
MKTSSCNQSTLTSIMPPLNEEVIHDQEDGSSTTCNLLQQINTYGNYNKIINSSNTNINPVTINVDNQQFLSSKLGQHRLVHFSLKINKYLFCIVLLLMIILALLLFSIFILKFKRNHSTDLHEQYERLLETHKSKEKIISEIQTQLNKTVNLLNNENKNSLVLFGQIFGHSNEKPFDDSLTLNFTSLPYLNGFCARDNDDGLESYQFFYLSPLNKKQIIESNVHGNQTKTFQKKFHFSEKNERIIQVQGRLVKKSLSSSNGTNQTISIITGLEFISNKGRISPLYSGELGEEFNEQYDGYTLGYVTGRSAQYIEQLQFIWYREKETNSDEDYL